MEFQRCCSGPQASKSCGALLSRPKVDPHTCSSCRGNKCSPSSTCPKCESWPELQWTLFSKKKKKESKRSPKKSSLISPRTSPSAKSERGSPSPSLTQSRGRGKSVAGKRPIAVPHESDVGESVVKGPTQTSGGSASVAEVCVVDEALVPAGPVSGEDPVWGNPETAPTPTPWQCFSGSAGSGGGRDKERRPTCSSDPDSIVWTTPFRSPMRQEEEFEGWNACRPAIRSPPAPSATLPLDFMEPSTPVSRPRTPRRLIIETDNSASSYSSDDYSSYSSFSSESSSGRDSRRKRKRSRRRRPSSHVSPAKKRSKSSRRGYKKNSSRKRYITVVRHRRESSKKVAAPVPASVAARAASVPLPSVSSALPACRPLAHFQLPQPSKSAAPPVRRELPLVRPSGSAPGLFVAAAPAKFRDTPLPRPSTSAIRVTPGGGRPMTATSAPAALPATEAAAPSPRQEGRDASAPTDPSVFDGASDAEVQIVDDLLGSGECSPDEVSSYRKVLALI
ncbi:uncharacterized protein [Palaemon carinicauda]|uniref:uncharacterized protein n=1 Tax=Palaemon carinicauda TaxID=392227 RepID=UPI0035B5881F